MTHSFLTLKNDFYLFFNKCSRKNVTNPISNNPDKCSTSQPVSTFSFWQIFQSDICVLAYWHILEIKIWSQTLTHTHKNTHTHAHTHSHTNTHKLQKNTIIWHALTNHLENKITSTPPMETPSPFPALLLCFKCQPHVLSFYESILLARGYLFENAKIGICSKMQRFLSLLSIHRKKSNAKTHSNIRIE